jgi:Serine protease gd N-terminus
VLPTLLQKYAGKIEQIGDKNSTTDSQQEIKYSIHFPIQSPLPLLTKLTVNDEVICSQTPRTIIFIYSYKFCDAKILLS